MSQVHQHLGLVRESETGLGSRFSGALSCLSACRWQFYRPLARAGLSTRQSLASHSMPSRARRRRLPHGISYHISGYLGQRDEPFSELIKENSRDASIWKPNRCRQSESGPRPLTIDAAHKIGDEYGVTLDFLLTGSRFLSIISLPNTRTEKRSDGLTWRQRSKQPPAPGDPQLGPPTGPFLR